MFGIFRCIRRTLLPTVLVCVFITFFPNIPPYATYIPYGNQLKAPQTLPPDTTLNNAERILEGQLVGAEAFTVHKGALYSGLHGGFVVQVLPHKVQPVVKTGKDCDGIHQEHICGRPLGLRVRNDILYIADAYNGIYSHVIANGPGKPTHILGPDVIVDGKPAKIFNSVEVDQDGNIYFTSSSSEFDINEGLHALVSSGTGRLLKFDPKNNKVTSLIDNLLFANGIALSADGESLFVAETVGRKVLKYHIKTGNVQTILEGLPGLPDNIQYAGDNTFWVSIVSSSDDEYPALTDVLADWPNIRKFVGRSLFLLELPFKIINQYYPNSFCELAAYHIGHLGPIFAILPEKVTIIRFDGNTGKILDSFRGNNGAVKGISDVAVVGDFLYLGSPANSYVGRVQLPKGKFAQTEEAGKFKWESSSGAHAQAYRAAEEARAKKAAEEAKVRKAAEEAQAKKAAENVKRAAEEAKAKKAAEEAKRAAEEAKAKKAAEEVKRAAEEAKAKRAAEEAKAKKAAEDAKRAAEEAKAKKAAEEAKKAAEAAAKAKAAEEAKSAKAAEEAKRAAQAAAKAKDDISKEKDIKTNKVSDDAGKAKVHGDKVKTEL